MKRMIFSVLVLGLMVFAGVPAEAKRSGGGGATTTGSHACLNGTVTWQPTTITGKLQFMPVAISFSDPDGDGDAIRLDVGVPTSTDPSCPFETANVPSTVSGFDTTAITDTIELQATPCAVKPLNFDFPVTCYEGDTGLSETVHVVVNVH